MKQWLLIVVVFTLAGNAFTGSDKKKEEAEALMRTAAELSQLEASNAPPFHLYVDFKLEGLVSGPVSGHFMWISASPTQWRREVSFSGYTEIEVGKQAMIWKKRSLDFTPQSASWIHALISNYDQLVFLDEEKVDRVYREPGLRCVSLRTDMEYRDLCFDPSGTLHRVFYPNENTSYVYSEYRSFGQKLFPYSLRVIAHGRTVVHGTVKELVLEQSPDPELFEPPPGTEKVAGCLNPTPGRLTKFVEPSYTYLARSQGRVGSVYLSIHIAPDGTVRKIRVLGTAGPDLDDAAVAAVSQWKYSPFMCAGVPVEAEKQITINFTRTRTN